MMARNPSRAAWAISASVGWGDTDNAGVRATYFIDPEGVIRGVTWYPMTIGRSIDEMVRMLAALKRSADGSVLTPAGWQPGDDVLVPPAQTAETAIGDDAPADWFHQTQLDRCPADR